MAWQWEDHPVCRLEGHGRFVAVDPALGSRGGVVRAGVLRRNRRPRRPSVASIVAPICVLVMSATLSTCGRGSSPLAPTPLGESDILLIKPATVLLRPGDSVTFEALLSTAPGNDLLPVAAQWSIDDAAVASVTPDGMVTALHPGHARLTARAGRALVIHPIDVDYEEPLVFSGTYVPTSCSSDYGPVCTMAMKDALYPRPFRIRFRSSGGRIGGELTLLAGVEANESSGPIDGLMFGDTITAAETYLVNTSLPYDGCCRRVRDWTLSLGSGTGSFIESHDDPRPSPGASLTLTNRILEVSPGER